MFLIILKKGPFNIFLYFLLQVQSKTHAWYWKAGQSSKDSFGNFLEGQNLLPAWKGLTEKCEGARPCKKFSRKGEAVSTSDDEGQEIIFRTHLFFFTRKYISSFGNSLSSFTKLTCTLSTLKNYSCVLKVRVHVWHCDFASRR